MATKDISDEQVCKAYAEYHRALSDRLPLIEIGCPYAPIPWPYEILHRMTGQPEKVCYRAMERAEDRGLIEVGTSLRSGWLSTSGKLLAGDGARNAFDPISQS